MLAKGLVLGAQFEALFEDGLYYKLAEHANRMADLLREGLRAVDCAFFSDSPTNQIFPILSDSLIETLAKDYAFEFWSRIDTDHQAIRLVTSWATPRRVNELYPTEKAKEIYPKIVEIIDSFNMGQLEGLTDIERDIFMRLLQKVFNHVKPKP